jgi:uncharacterized membrane protein YdbT with pleckstrin-like domain
MYLQESLSPGEKILKISEYHWMYMLAACFWGMFYLAIAAGIVFLGIIYHYYDIAQLMPWQVMDAARELAWADYTRAFRHTNILIRVTAFLFVLMTLIQIGASYLVCKTTEIAVTNRRVLLKRGLVSRRVEEMRSEYVESADLNQGIMGRIFDYGQVKVYGTGAEHIFFPRYTADPVGFRRAIQSARGVPVQQQMVPPPIPEAAA